MKSKEKPQYSIPQNVGYVIREVWENDRPFLLFVGMNILTALLQPVAAMYLPASVLAVLESHGSVTALLLTILGFTVVLAVLSATRAWSNEHLLVRKMLGRMRLGFQGYCHSYTVDYAIYDTAKYRETKKKAFEVTGNNNSALEAVWPALVQFMTGILGIVTYASVLHGLGWWIALLAAVCAILSYLVRSRVMDRRFAATGEWVKYASKPYYLNDKAGNYQYGKDIRLFAMGGWFREIFTVNIRLCEDWQRRHETPVWRADVLDCMLTLLREGIAYGYLIWCVLHGRLAASQFVLYFAAIAGFSSWVLSAANQLSELRRMSNQICDFRALMELPDRFRHSGGETAEKHLSRPLEIRLEHVSYRYPGAEADTIHDLSLTITPGERLAVVGLNGAGKTTLVKLICGLIDPTEGTVYCNGIDIREYNRPDFYRLFATVFQDFCILPLTIAENISGRRLEDTDFDWLNQCIEQADLTDKIRKLPGGVRSTMVREVNEDAVELSGGETQRLMLARALYKKAPMVILDEPTAALDPIAEHQLYMKYHDLTSHATAIFISHRLASTRFCDTIIYLENGAIAETGSHDELMAKGEKYYALYELQSQYYRSPEEAGEPA